MFSLTLYRAAFLPHPSGPHAISDFPNFFLTPDANHFHIPSRPPHQGAYRDRHERGAGCDGRGLRFWRGRSPADGQRRVVL